MVNVASIELLQCWGAHRACGDLVTGKGGTGVPAAEGHPYVEWLVAGWLAADWLAAAAMH